MPLTWNVSETRETEIKWGSICQHTLAANVGVLGASMFHTTSSHVVEQTVEKLTPFHFVGSVVMRYDWVCGADEGLEWDYIPVFVHLNRFCPLGRCTDSGSY